MIPIAIHADVPLAVTARAALRPPAIVSPAPREASFGLVTGKVFAGTARVRVLVDGTERASRAVAGASRFRFSLDLPPREVRIRVVAESADGDRAGRSVGRVRGLPREGRPRTPLRSALDPVLARRVTRLARDYPGTAAVYVQDLRTGRGAAWNARARFPAASTLKLAIAIETLRTLPARPAPGSEVDRLLWSMLVDSDNEAANRLLVRLGGSTSGGANRVNALMRSLRIDDTLMYGGYEVLAAARPAPIPVRVEEQPAFGVGKYTTAWDLARMHRAVHWAAVGRGPLHRASGTFKRRDARYLLRVLAHVADRGKLDRYLPSGTSVLHKAGWITYARHDAGVVYVYEGSFVVAVLTWNARGVGASSDVLAGQVAKAARDRFREGPDELAAATA